jgi:HD superfamily phosphodiesterase
LRVVHWVWILAKEEKASVERNVIVALFHDVSHFVSEDYRKHGERSAEIAMVLKATIDDLFILED